MSERSAVLARIRASLGDVAANESPEPVMVPGPDPSSHEAAVSLFVERVEEYRGTVRRVDAAGISAAVRDLCFGRLLVAPGAEGSWLPHDIETIADAGFTATELDAFDGVLTGCHLAIAETGTIVLDGGPASGRRAISLVPDLHICVVRSDQIVGTVPEAIDGLKSRKDAPLTFISGPSATSDIEFRRVEGVHGPRRLEVILARVG